MHQCVLGYNGERLDAVCRTYHSGRGYRDYNPLLLRFHCPDSWSPFNEGGINAYSYCAGDPINCADPSGHISWQTGVGIGLNILGILGAVFTGGASIAAAGSVDAALATASTLTLTGGSSALIGDITGLISAVSASDHAKMSAALGWISFAAGIVSLGIGMAAVAARMLRFPMLARDSDNELLHPQKIYSLGTDAEGHRWLEPKNNTKHAFYYFDTTKKGRRLNMVVHGIKKYNIVLADVDGKLEAADVMIQRINSIAETESFRSVRLLMCHSADGENSFAKQVSTGLGLPLKGYRGVVSIIGRNFVEPILNGEAAGNYAIQTFKHHDPLLSKFDVRFNYRPVRFDPSQ
ncbi:RHS repeat-associated core domain-containing protein [Winslowiella iniecta]|uniref:RHS repeat-associated core domain-containing protein n=1 Tax=Winslowiella iniecta TaxID=1560201 RepID=UPI00069FE882|nr:RHS repeat-associated core domain-containing protein [Winslowiella iniecta]